MKNKKRLVIFCGIILFVILVAICWYFIFNKNKNVYNENNNRIVSKEEYLGYSFIQDGNVNYYINNGNKFVAFNKETGSKIVEIEISQKEFYKILSSTGDIIKLYSYKEESDSDNEYKLFNANGDLLKTSSNIIKVSNDFYNNKSYYIYENSLYDENNELLYENLFKNIDLSNEYFRFNVYNSFVLFSNNGSGKLINLKNDESIDIKSYFENGKYVEIDTKTNFYLLDLEKDELMEYTKYEDKPYGKILYKDDKKYVYINLQIIEYEDKLNYEGYSFDIKVCKDGFKIYKDDKLISDECFYQIQKDTYNNTYVNNSNSYYLRDGKLDEYISVGKYYINSLIKGEIVVYNDKKEKVNDTCINGFSYYRNGLYVCSTDTNSYLVDEKLKKVTNEYDGIICSDTYCSIEKDGLYGLLYNDKVILDPIYQKIYVKDNAIIAEDPYKLDYFLLGFEDFLSEENLYREIDDYKNINIDEIIEQYDLKDIEELINIDSEFFKQYAYVVVNNGNLEGYKKHVFKTYKEVILNKEHLDKEYFLFSLKRLSIQTFSSLATVGTSGEYNPGGPYIEILFNTEERIVYHELTHFIDDRINKSGSGMEAIPIYKYLNNYTSQNELSNLPKSDLDEIEYVGNLLFNFLAEGGAEYNSAVYLNDFKASSYPQQIILYSIFSYIYGSDFMNEVFFDREGQDLLFRKFRDVGYNYDEIEKFADSTSRDKIGSLSSKDRLYCIDMLVNMYEKERDNKWYNDKIFSYLVSQLLPGDLKKDDTNRYEEYQKMSATSSQILDKMYKCFDNMKYILIKSNLYYNDNLYIIVNVQRINNNEFKDELWSIDYDFEKDEIIDYKIIE